MPRLTVAMREGEARMTAASTAVFITEAIDAADAALAALYVRWGRCTSVRPTFVRASLLGGLVGGGGGEACVAVPPPPSSVRHRPTAR